MTLRDQLAEAQGRSEFVIVVVADVRGFSAFSKRHESTDIAMFIKRFYMRLIDDYFSEASFFKTRGDGLLMTFTYSEKNLQQIASNVISKCFQCLVEFPGICAGDPMINFKTPENIGFGIARGTACCLYVEEDAIIDYSGHLLNLTSRLMDLARPGGIVIDGNFLQEIIPEDLRDSFSEKKVYIRSISEEKPYKVFYLEDYVNIPEEFLSPVKGGRWHTIHKAFKMQEIGELRSLRVHLPTNSKSGSEIRVTMIYPKMRNRREVKGYRAHRAFKNFEYCCEADEPKVILDLKEAFKYLRGIGLGKTRPVQFKIQYMPDRPLE